MSPTVPPNAVTARPVSVDDARAEWPPLSPRQRECLRYVWERQATSKEIAIALGISKSTVDSYIGEAVEQLGARDRRHAAVLAFSHTPRAGSGDDPARVGGRAPARPAASSPTEAWAAVLPIRPRDGAPNTASGLRTLGWIVLVAIGSMVTLALAVAIGSGLPSVAVPLVHAVRRLIN